MMKEIAGQFPSLLNSVLHERDQFLTYNLRRCPGPVVVAVVGLGHVQGIVDNWNKQIDMAEIAKIPGPGPWYYKWVCLGLVLLLLGVLVVSTYLLFSYVPLSWILCGVVVIIVAGYLYSRSPAVSISEVLDQMEAKKKE